MTMLTQQDFQAMLYGIHHAKRARDWGEHIALMYSANFNVDAYGATTEGNDLSAFGWTVTGAPPYVAPSGADFLTPDDKGTTGGIHTDTASDVVQSPSIFGDWSHGAAVARLIGAVSGDGTPSMPRYLIADFVARLSANAAETGSGMGFIEDGGSAAVANDHLACIYTDGTSWKLRSGAAASAAIAVDDTNPHRFRIVLDKVDGLAWGFVDDFRKQAGQSIAIETDEFPAAFGWGVVSAGTNDPVMANVTIRYAWHGWY